MNLKKMFLWILLVSIMIMLALRSMVWLIEVVFVPVVSFCQKFIFGRVDWTVVICIISVPLLFVVVYWAYKCSSWLLYKFCGKKKKNDKNTYVGFLSDSPILSKENDIFNRNPFVKGISNLILTGPCEDAALFVALYGKWGSGKSSICNLLREMVKSDSKDVVFLDFSPWQYSYDSDLQSAYFELLADKLFEISEMSVASSCKSFSAYMRCAGFHRKLGSIHWLIDVLRIWFFNSVHTHDELSKKFKSIISQGGKRIVVVIDDLERLPSDQVCNVIRFIKANGDLPGVVYLVLSDEAYLSSAIMKMIPNVKNSHIDNGREYLEKIFPFRLYVPPISLIIMKKFVKAHIEEVLIQYGLKNKVKEIDIDEELSYFVDTMRVAKSIVNDFVCELDVAKAQVGDRTYVNRHIGDMIALDILKLKNPIVYSRLPRLYWLFVESHFSSNAYLEDNGGIKEEILKRRFPELNDNDWRVLVQFMSKRLDVKKNSNGVAFAINSPQSPEKVLNYRLASSLNFNDYFLIGGGQNIIAEDDMRVFYEKIKNAEYPKDLISRLDSTNELVILLYALEAQELFRNDMMERAYLKTLVEMSALSLQNAQLPEVYELWGGWGATTVYTRIYRCILFYLNKMLEERNQTREVRREKLERILLPILQEVIDDVYIISEFLGHDKQYPVTEESVYYKAIFTLKNREKVEELFLDKIPSFVASGKLACHPNFFEIFRCWKILLREKGGAEQMEKFKEVCGSLLKDVDFVVRMLIFFCKDNRVSSAADEQLEVQINLEELEKYLGDSACNEIYRTLEDANKLDLYNYHAYISLRFVLDAKQKGVSCSIEAQRENLLSYIKTKEYKEERASRVDESLRIYA